MVDPRTIMPPTGYRVAFTLQGMLHARHFYTFPDVLIRHRFTFFCANHAANGIRNYSCTLTKTISVGNSTATGLLSGDFTGVAGVNQVGCYHQCFPYYFMLSCVACHHFMQWMYPQINLTTPQGQPAGTIIADSTIVTYQVPTEPLLWARWPIYLIQGPLIPWCAWVTRTNSTGGAPPPDSSCTHPGQVIQVPYTAVYTYYTCD